MRPRESWASSSTASRSTCCTTRARCDRSSSRRRRRRAGCSSSSPSSTRRARSAWSSSTSGSSQPDSPKRRRRSSHLPSCSRRTSSVTSTETWPRSSGAPRPATTPMSLVNYATREITCKIVYYGPGRSGKTTNLHYIYGQVPEDRKGKMVSLATQTDRTLFFDFLPLDLGQISGFATRFQHYTVPGQVYYQTTRKLVLQGADGVVFVADSQARQLDENFESMQDLHANLAEGGIDTRTVPMVIQYNKQDLPKDLILTLPELSDALNFRGVPEFSADALHGPGVFETLRGISELVLRRLSASQGAAR